MALKDTFGGQMLAGMGGSLFNGLFNIGSAKRQYKYQSRLQQQQYDLNEQAAQSAFARQLQFYEQQRNDEYAYNDPSAVRERYEGAGLNPNAAFGVAGSYQPANAPSGSVNAQQGVGLGQASAFPMSDPVEMALKLAQIRNIDAQSKKTESETGDRDEFLRHQKQVNDNLEQMGIGIALKNELDAYDLRFKNEVYNTEVRVRKQTAENMAKQAEVMNRQLIEYADKHSLVEDQRNEINSRIWLNAQQAALAEIRADYHGRLTQAQIDNLTQQTFNLESTKALIEEQIKTEGRKPALLRAQTYLNRMQGYRANQETRGVKRREDAYDSDAGRFVTEMGEIIRALSPLK